MSRDARSGVTYRDGTFSSVVREPKPNGTSRAPAFLVRVRVVHRLELGERVHRAARDTRRGRRRRRGRRAPPAVREPPPGAFGAGGESTARACFFSSTRLNRPASLLSSADFFAGAARANTFVANSFARAPRRAAPSSPPPRRRPRKRRRDPPGPPGFFAFAFGSVRARGVPAAVLLLHALHHQRHRVVVQRVGVVEARRRRARALHLRGKQVANASGRASGCGASPARRGRRARPAARPRPAASAGSAAPRMVSARWGRASLRHLHGDGVLDVRAEERRLRARRVQLLRQRRGGRSRAWLGSYTRACRTSRTRVGIQPRTPRGRALSSPRGAPQASPPPSRARTSARARA